ncbi:MAG: glutathione peroxidase, partial [Immundisolibacteraceae bacterium]|nr:glutathione peroxidase [Immundisolibacteraceae bacterium]
MTDFHSIEMTGIDGQSMPLSTFKGQVVLLVNVASKCGLTPQYSGLQQLHDQYGDQGFSVVGLPCNQFGGQEPGSEAEIVEFCETKYSVNFPMTAKIEVNGDGRHGLYDQLVGDSASFPGDITWNFEKFLVGKDGAVIQRFGPKTAPDDAELVAAIEAALK